MFLEKIEILSNSPNFPLWIQNIPKFKQNTLFEFKDGLNIIIGENMSGKTTLLKLLSEKAYLPFIKITGNTDIHVCFFDSKKLMSMDNFSYGEFQTYEFIKFMSYTGTLLLDEPDRGLDPFLQRSMLKHLCIKLEQKNQIILTTNSPYVYYMLRNKASNIIEMTENYKAQMDIILEEFRK